MGLCKLIISDLDCFIPSSRQTLDRHGRGNQSRVQEERFQSRRRRGDFEEMILSDEHEDTEEGFLGTPTDRSDTLGPEPFDSIHKINGETFSSIKPLESVTPFGQRKSKFVVQSTLNDLPNVENVKKEHDHEISEDDIIKRVQPSSRCSLVIHGSQPEPGCRFMYDKIEDKFNFLENRIRKHATTLVASGLFEEPIDRTVASQKSVFAVGMICCEEEGRLKKKPVLLQSSVEHSGGQRVISSVSCENTKLSANVDLVGQKNRHLTNGSDIRVQKQKIGVRVKGSILPLEQWMLQIAEYHARTVVSEKQKKTGFGGRSKTGGDGCICYLEHDRDQQNLEFLGMKQVKEMSLVRCVFDATSSNDLTSGSYAVGFSSTNFLIWNLMSEAKVVQVPCGGWRRPYAYYLGDVPEIKNCFAFVKKTAREKVLEDYEKIVEAAAKQIKGCTEFEKGVINEQKDSEFVLLILQD
ncbi:hypothetical protein LOK49_LG07G03445 [Camellia lanceoleosa]|uniref:Uncharacterized protein n=1 Tax=Camellia lanceoleosa TaxID=1840588 RepID=A0ACC0GY83_9ERIC|nr:hypothetical protein LOK49_LG07G03445 [Camellia lanceoleosa]